MELAGHRSCRRRPAGRCEWEVSRNAVNGGPFVQECAFLPRPAKPHSGMLDWCRPRAAGGLQFPCAGKKHAVSIWSQFRVGDRFRVGAMGPGSAKQRKGALHRVRDTSSCVPRMLRSAPHLRRGALLIRGPRRGGHLASLEAGGCETSVKYGVGMHNYFACSQPVLEQTAVDCFVRGVPGGLN
jgi:hypothetical protein